VSRMSRTEEDGMSEGRPPILKCGRTGSCEDYVDTCSGSIDVGTYEECCLCGEPTEACVCHDDDGFEDDDENIGHPLESGYWGHGQE
jgi:hypothetical protein